MANRVAPMPDMATLQMELQQREARVKAIEQQLGWPQQQQRSPAPLPPIAPAAPALGMQPPPYAPAAYGIGRVPAAPFARPNPQAEGMLPAPTPEAEKAKPFDECKSMLQATFVMVLSVALYLGIGFLAYTYLELNCAYSGNPTGRCTYNEIAYFLAVTMSTVGYGDIYPTSDSSRIFTLFMIFFGIIFVFSQVGSVLEALLVQPITSRGRALLNRIFPPAKIDIDGDGDADFVYPRYFALFYAKGLIPSIVLNVGLQAVSALVFNALEGWGYGLAFYHCLVTATTVGYGDVGIETEGGRIWACFHILMSVVLLAEAIATVGELAAERAEAFKRLEQLSKKLDHDMLNGLLLAADELRQGGVNEQYTAEENGLSELEFVSAMLLQLGVCKWSQVRPFIKKFRALDVDGSGRLGRDDLELAVKYSEDELLRMRQGQQRPPLLQHQSTSTVRPSAFELQRQNTSYAPPY